MASINITNLKTRITVLMEVELEAYLNGEREFRVFDQHTPCVIESALEQIQEGAFETWVEKNPDANLEAISVRDWATLLSAWEAPELDSCWTD